VKEINIETFKCIFCTAPLETTLEKEKEMHWKCYTLKAEWDAEKGINEYEEIVEKNIEKVNKIIKDQIQKFKNWDLIDFVEQVNTQITEKLKDLDDVNLKIDNLENRFVDIKRRYDKIIENKVEEFSDLLREVSNSFEDKKEEIGKELSESYFKSINYLKVEIEAAYKEILEDMLKQRDIDPDFLKEKQQKPINMRTGFFYEQMTKRIVGLFYCDNSSCRMYKNAQPIEIGTYNFQSFVLDNNFNIDPQYSAPNCLACQFTLLALIPVGTDFV